MIAVTYKFLDNENENNLHAVRFSVFIMGLGLKIEKSSCTRRRKGADKKPLPNVECLHYNYLQLVIICAFAPWRANNPRLVIQKISEVKSSEAIGNAKL